MTVIPAAKTEKSSTQKMTDQELYRLCKKYGENARIWRQRFAGLLPEVLQRRLYEKKGFSSIFEFAAKLAGMSQEQVRLVLNLERKFKTAPALQSLLITGEVSSNKLVRIAAIATPENQEILAQHVQILSKNALETLVRDEKAALAAEAELSANMETSAKMSTLANAEIENQNGSQKPLFDAKVLPGHSKAEGLGAIVKIMEKLSPEVKDKLLHLIDKNIDINEIILTALDNREEEIVRAKECTSREQLAVEKQYMIEQKPFSRHVPARVRHVLDAEQGDKCSVPGCLKPAEVMHHELPFAMTKSHDPYYLQKLCRAHHELQHSIHIKYLKIRQKAINSC